MDPTLTPSNLPPVSLKRSKSSRGGEVFNRQFVAAQIQGHQMLRSIQEEYLKEGKAQPTINVTKLVWGMINEHLALLLDLKGSKNPNFSRAGDEDWPGWELPSSHKRRYRRTLCPDAPWQISTTSR
jgi:hypothetical protein